MKIVWLIYRDVLLLHALIFIPLLFDPGLYFSLMALFTVCGLPATLLFRMVFIAARKLFAANIYDSWATALFCAPAVCVITALAASLAAYFTTGFVTGVFEYSISYCFFGILAVIQAVATLFERNKDLHRFIYPHLYVQPLKENTTQPAGMVYPQRSTTGHTKDH